MKPIKEIAFVVYPVRDMAVARQFYENTLGLRPGGLNQRRWVEYEVGEGTFAISSFEEIQPKTPGGGGVAFEVDDIKDWFKRLKQEGVTFVTDMMDFPSCQMFLIKDPFGNNVTIHRRK
jgi:catechol 2,3-dioxygenase-like lactoylglutathione lyase family enzyme